MQKNSLEKERQADTKYNDWEKQVKGSKLERGLCNTLWQDRHVHTAVIIIIIIRPPHIVCRKALINAAVLSFFSFLSIHGSQQQCRGQPSNVFRTFCPRWTFINWPRDLAHPAANFHRGQNVQNLASFSTSLDFEPPAFENAARYLNSETNMFSSNDGPMSAKLGEVWPTHQPFRTVQRMCPTPKNLTTKCAKSSITVPRIDRFCSNLVESLFTQPQRYHTVQGQGIKGQGHSMT